MKLTNTAISNLKKLSKTTRLFDGGGLYLEATPQGGKYWRLKYRFLGKEKRLALGVYPDVTLKMARDRREEARRLLADGIDPGEHKKSLLDSKKENLNNTFQSVADEWHQKQSNNWTEQHSLSVKRRLELNVFPWLGDRPIADITPKEILSVIRRIEDRGALETAHRVYWSCGQVFRYGVATGRVMTDPCRDLRGFLPPTRVDHRAAITEPVKVGELLRAIDGYDGTMIVKNAMKLAPLVFVRPGELRQAEWKDIDLDKREWRYTISKTNTPHIVPLSNQALKILEEIQPLTGKGQYVFPSARSAKRPMSDNAILAAFRRMGYDKKEMSVHGFRAMARTILDEVLGFRPDFIEHQLAHAVRDPNGRAYNRTSHLKERTIMMQKWADYLDTLKAGAEVIPIKFQHDLS